MKKKGINKGRIVIAAVAVLAVALLAAAGIGMYAEMGTQEAMDYPVQGFSNMSAHNGTVYGGVNAPYGEAIAHKTSIFAVQDDKIYYVDKTLEAFESVTDELLAVKCSDMDGSNEVTLAEDVFLAGTGHEKLIGDKLFYGYEYDDNYRMRYAYIDLNTGKRSELPTDRIETIIGYDGNYLYYRGYDVRTRKYLIGRIRLKNGKDETLTVFAGMDNEEGYFDSILFHKGRLYCLALTKAADSYDYRTYEYKIQIRNARNGKLEKELPYTFTGSSNYSVLVAEDEIFVSVAGEIVAFPITGEGGMRTVTSMEPDEYWGILHFAPGDGYLYYEAIAEIDEETGNNDYFYRVPLAGGEAELLEAWFTV